MAELLIRARLATAAAAALLVGSVVIGGNPITAQAQAVVDIVGPAGSGSFGSDVLVLSNGNYVVADPQFDSGSLQDVGAVYLYNGATNQVISAITGSTADDFIGEKGLKEVGTSNFVIISPAWDNGAVVDAGAVTWVNGTTGFTGQVSATNSLVGTTDFDSVGLDGVTVLTNNKNYVVDSSVWAGGDLGAVTWGSGNAGVTGTISSANSLVGANPLDAVGVDGVTALTNGNYVVGSGDWRNGGAFNAGAVTWGDGGAGTKGVVSTSNSLVGSSPDDLVGVTTLGSGVTALTNGNYVVASSSWDDGGSAVDVGAVTWASGSQFTSQIVDPSNSIIGTTDNDNVGSGGVTALSNGNYVVASPSWDGAAVDVGAVTWASGLAATTNVIVATTNSIFGSSALDNVGSGGVTALSNGSYVVASPSWDGANTAVGAVTWAGGTVATHAAVGSTNSLVGSSDNDNVGGRGVTALTNGNFVVASPSWDNGTTGDVGAATWGSGTAGIAGLVTSANSLVGTSAGDQVGLDGVTALTNGNYVVDSSEWDKVSPAAADVGAVTWANGASGLTGSVTAGNSLVGAVALDSVGFDGVTPLSNGNYVVASGDWHNGPNLSAGAVTRGSGSGGTVGAVTAANSLVGTATDDFVGTLGSGSGVKALANGDYVVVSDIWDNGIGNPDVGAATYGPAGGITGPVTAANSALGTPPGVVMSASDGLTADDAIAIRTTQNRVLLLKIDIRPPVFAAAHPDVSVVAAPGAMSQVVTFTPPAATDNRGASSVVCTPGPGASFAVGATTVTCTATDGVGNTATTSFKVTVTGTPVVTPVGTPAGTPADYVPLAPARLADTRSGENTIDSLFAGEGARSGGSTLELTVAGRGGVAADATAVALNVTAVTPSGDGFVTVYPCGSDRPTASNVNYTTGAVIPNAVVAKIGSAGKVCFFVSAATHLVIDANGYFPTTTTLFPLNPARLLETRSGLTTVDNFQQGEGAREAGSTTEVQVTDRATVSSAAAAVLNITITEAKGPGFATVYPCGIPKPLASTINYDAGSTVANLVVSKIGTDGKVCIFTQSAAHILADVNGYFPVVSSYHPLVPARLLETRPGELTVDGQSQGAGLLPSRTITEVTVADRGGVPAGAASVVLNVTVTGPTEPGFVTVYPCGIDRPLASNLNYGVGTTAANAVIVKVGTGGKVCVYNSNPTQLIADVSGYFPA